MLDSYWLVLIASLLFPPAGLVLLWRRSGTRFKRKLMDSILICCGGVGYLVLFFGLKFQLDGSGIRPHPIFYKPDSHYAELELNRARQGALPTVEAAAAPAAEAKPVAPVASAYWTAFRGPNRDGHYDQAPILTQWPASGLPLLWREPIGGGYASFAIAGGRAFTIEQRRHREAATAYDMTTGHELWANSWDAEFQETLGGDGPRATPTWDDGRVYALGAAGELRCLDAATGQRLWSRNILSDNHAENLQWGMAAAPLIVDENVIVTPGGPSGQSVVAYRKLTGEPVWKAALDDKQDRTPRRCWLHWRESGRS